MIVCRRSVLLDAGAFIAIESGDQPMERWLKGARQLDEEVGRQAGLLLARSGLSDATDAALVSMADHGDEIITSDPDDLDLLVNASQRRINITSL